jgi:probable rRNA maturation factor
MPIEIINSQTTPVPIKRWQNFSNRVLKNLRLKTIVSIRLVDNRTIQKFNRRYLGHDYPTDVLSFPVNRKPNLKSPILGDVLISVPMAKTHAKQFKTSLNEELALYVVHGILHLIGFEDHPKSKRLQMQRKETQVLGKLKNQWPLKKQKRLS